jgi:hypothetical protein
MIRTSNDSCCSITGIVVEKLFLMHMNIMYNLCHCMLSNNEALR